VNIVVYGVLGDAANDTVWRQLEQLHNVHLEFVVCPPSASELYRLPFITDERGSRYFGIDCIQDFVDHRLGKGAVRMH